MDYSKLSDQQINAAVAITFGEKIGQPVNGLQMLNIDGEYLCSTFDPCNNPADAWPILLQKGIAVAPPIRNERGWVSWCSVNEYTVFKTRDANPLRAAMIVFLMMQESE